MGGGAEKHLLFMPNNWWNWQLKWVKSISLQWRHYECDGISNCQRLDFLLNSLFRRKSKKTSKLGVTGLCEGNSLWLVNYAHKGPVTWKLFPFDDGIVISADIIYPWAKISQPLLYQYATYLFLIHFSIWCFQNCHHDFSTVCMWVTWRSWLHCFISSCNYLWISPIPTSTLVSCCVPLLACNRQWLIW